MATFRIKNSQGEWEEIPILGSYAAVAAAQNAANVAQNASMSIVGDAQAARQNAERAEQAAQTATSSVNTALAERLVPLTQAEYDALETKNPNTFYFVLEE